MAMLSFMVSAFALLLALLGGAAGECSLGEPCHGAEPKPAMFEGAYGPRTRNVTQGHLTGIVAGHYLFPSAAQPRPSGSASVRC